MKNVNQRREYAKIKWKETAASQIIGTGLHATNKKMLEEEGISIECGGEIDFVKMDRDEIRRRVIDRNRRKLDKLSKRKETEELVSRLLGSITALKSPEESKPNG
jgi:hypothetical protein